jgi:hemerythrin-like metal-binding protein
MSMSGYFHWDASTYGIKVPEMDREHEVLIGHMNTVHHLHQSHAGRAAIGPALNELVTYTRRHFADEEAYMSRIGFPGLRIHAGIHRQLLERVDVFAAEFARTGALSEDFFVFLKMWLKAHICGIDSKYAQHSAVA